MSLQYSCKVRHEVLLVNDDTFELKHIFIVVCLNTADRPWCVRDFSVLLCIIRPTNSDSCEGVRTYKNKTLQSVLECFFFCLATLVVTVNIFSSREVTSLTKIIKCTFTQSFFFAITFTWHLYAARFKIIILPMALLFVECDYLRASHKSFSCSGRIVGCFFYLIYQKGFRLLEELKNLSPNTLKIKQPELSGSWKFSLLLLLLSSSSSSWGSLSLVLISLLLDANITVKLVLCLNILLEIPGDSLNHKRLRC